MFQPFFVMLYRYGFLMLLFSTILFIIVSHLTARPDLPDSPGPISVGQVVEHEQGHDR